jgi:predicted nucleic acid-binding Zn ribbon protein
MFKRLSETLREKIKKQAELSRQLEIVAVFDLYQENLKKIFPRSPKIKLQSLRGKVLTVLTTSSVMANELRFYEHRIIDAINRQLGKTVIKRVVYKY